MTDKYAQLRIIANDYARASGDMPIEPALVVRLLAENHMLRSALEVARIQIELDRDVRREYDKTLECIDTALAQQQGESDAKRG